jgi:3'-phosphoadenosine 5'-phosphosulfate sulfotransferase (PAPS reductase)/FAD synthetase
MSKVIAWWSGGITSAVACKLAIDFYGKDNVQVLFIDTQNEHEDTYRFLKDCEKWYGCLIGCISAIGGEYESIQDVWRKHKSLNVATGAICSTQLKRRVREKWQKEIDYDHQVFGFEFEKKEFNRAMGLKMNHPKAKPIFPLLMMGWDKDKCLEVVEEAGIDIPLAYQMGFRNNNCLNTGCVQGGIGYWQKMQRDFPKKFESMANMEHELTELKGQPITMLKDQSNKAKQSGNTLVFLKKHKDYPQLKCLDDMPQMEVKPLFECNGFCGTNDLNPKNNTSNQINFKF